MKEIVLTKAQQKAVDISFNNFKSGKNTVIAGYAGTGKSTLVSFLIEKIAKELNVHNYTFAAFTGKAAQVLTNKGNPAMTLHKLMYDPHEDPWGNIVFELKADLPYELVIVDECSMLPMDMLQDLYSFEVPLVFLGDPGQLPPFEKENENHLLDHPDIFLTEVLRQALDSPIIRLSMKIRNHEPIDDFNFPEAKVVNKMGITTKEILDADMIIVGTNNMRKSVNRAVRKLLGKEGLFSEEEKLICTKNYWEKDNIENSLTNGTVGFLRNTKEGFIQPYSKLKTKFDVLEGSFTSESGLKKFVKLDKVFLKDEEPMFTFEQRKYMNRKNLPKEFTYAYAITGHKSQGSEWDKVVIFEEPFPYGEDHVKWLYTCVTRAKKSVILVRP